ncbi:MAG: aromatic amino acid transport family protein [Candidatus Pacearchaeota archaeon]
MEKNNGKIKRGKNKGFIDAIATITGTTIGAGMFGIPYVFAKSSFLIGIMNLLLIFFVILFVNLAMAKITLIRKKPYELTGYAKILLGNFGKHAMAIVTFLSISGALLAYLIGTGEALADIFSFSSLSAYHFTLISFIILAFIVFFDLKGVEKSETFATALLLLVALAVIILGIFNFDPKNIDFSLNLSFSKLFLPYGVILFAFLCLAAIPEARQELKGNEKKFKHAIIIGTTIPLIIYFLFTLAVVGVTGVNTSELAIPGLAKLGKTVVLLGDILIILAMVTSFITLALALRWILQYDYKIKKIYAWFISCGIPIVMFLFGFENFIKTLSITGGVAGGLSLILILIMAKRADKFRVKEIKLRISLSLFILLLILFVLGIIYQFLFINFLS